MQVKRLTRFHLGLERAFPNDSPSRADLDGRHPFRIQVFILGMNRAPETENSGKGKTESRKEANLAPCLPSFDTLEAVHVRMLSQS